tara:strand:+ start:1837 stop:2859 length:1023 start_codon:yes stop_codon:yes gene_type:complete
MKKVLLFESFIAENEKETAKEIFDELMDVNGEEIADIDSQEAMTILSRRGIRGGKANKIAKELLKLTSAIGESVVNEASLSGIEFGNDDDIHPTKFKPLTISLKKNKVKMEVEKEEGDHGYPEVKLTGKRKDIEKVLADIWGPDSIDDHEDAFESVVTEAAKPKEVKAVEKLIKAKGEEHFDVEGTWLFNHSTYNDDQEETVQFSWDAENGYDVTDEDGRELYIGTDAKAAVKAFKSVIESVVNESDAALKKEIKEAKKELKQLQKDYSDIADECKDLRSEIVDIKNDIKTHEQDGEDDMADMAGEQLEEKEEELELRLNDLDQCKMDLDEVKDWLKNPS